MEELSVLSKQKKYRIKEKNKGNSLSKDQYISVYNKYKAREVFINDNANKNIDQVIQKTLKEALEWYSLAMKSGLEMNYHSLHSNKSNKIIYNYLNLWFDHSEEYILQTVLIHCT